MIGTENLYIVEKSNRNIAYVLEDWNVCVYEESELVSTQTTLTTTI